MSDDQDQLQLVAFNFLFRSQENGEWTAWELYSLRKIACYFYSKALKRFTESRGTIPVEIDQSVLIFILGDYTKMCLEKKEFQESDPCGSSDPKTSEDLEFVD